VNTNTCHSQRNLYRVNHKIWNALAPTTGEQTCGRVRSSHTAPGGVKLNAHKLNLKEALRVARCQPGGAVIYTESWPATQDSVFDVYSEQRVLRYQEVLAKIKKEHQGA